MIVTPGIEAYLHGLAPSEDPVLRQMERLAEQREFPIIGPLVGRLCWVLATAIRARDIFEMGSGFGYSTWWFAQAVGETGRVVHTDASAANSEQAKTFLTQSGFGARVTFEVGDARDTIMRYPGPFDIIFVDIDKEGYPDALELARVRLRPGGLIITDNVLWGGRVLQPDSSAATQGVVQFNRGSHRCPDLVTTVLPLRDGVAVSVKVDEESNPFRRRRGGSQPPLTAKKG